MSLDLVMSGHINLNYHIYTTLIAIAQQLI